jgi:hypothetical protein
MGAADRDSLAATRVSALYLVSQLAAASADLAWRPLSPLRLAGLAIAFGLALLLGVLLAEALSAVGTAALRRRARLLAFLLVPVPAVFALVVAWSAPNLAMEAVRALVLLQVAVLLLSEAFGLELLALWGALLLALAAAAGGGLPGVIGLTGFLTFAGVFFSLDHVLRRLALWPQAPAPALGRVLREALPVLAAPVILLGMALLVLPAAPPVTDGSGSLSVTDSEVGRAYRWLILVALAGTGSLVLAFRWLRGRGHDTPPLVEMPESHVEAEELLEPPPDAPPRYTAARDHVIHAYLRVLVRARDAGIRLERSLTPREIESRVARPERELRLLTALFMDARYGADEPDPEAVGRAETASRAICSHLRVRPRPARRRPLLL